MWRFSVLLHFITWAVCGLMTTTVTVHPLYFIFAIIRGNRSKTTNCIIKLNKRTWSHLQLEIITHWSRERHGHAFLHGSLPSKSWMLSGTAAALSGTSDEKYQSFVSPSVLLLSCLQFQFSLPLFLFFFDAHSWMTQSHHFNRWMGGPAMLWIPSLRRPIEGDLKEIIYGRCTALYLKHFMND